MPRPSYSASTPRRNWRIAPKAAPVSGTSRSFVRSKSCEKCISGFRSHAADRKACKRSLSRFSVVQPWHALFANVSVCEVMVCHLSGSVGYGSIRRSALSFAGATTKVMPMSVFAKRWPDRPPSATSDSKRGNVRAIYSHLRVIVARFQRHP